jgi:hypothetical protein
MTMPAAARVVVAATAAALTLGAPGFVLAAGSSPAPATRPLIGVLSVAAGACPTGGAPEGSYLQVLDAGVPVPNPGSPCPGPGSVYTPLTGTGGLRTGTYQLDPAPTFDAAGGSRAAGIIRPVTVLAARLGLATTCADQEHAPTPTGACGAAPAFAPPALWAEPAGTGGCRTPAGEDCLYGDLSSLSASWAGWSAPGTAAGQESCAGTGACYDEGAAVGAGLAAPRCDDGAGRAPSTRVAAGTASSWWRRSTSAWRRG